MKTWINRIVLIAFTLLVGVGKSPAQSLPPGMDETFAVSSINPLLMIDADAVVRLEVIRFEVIHEGKALKKVRRVVTVLNQDGREEGELQVYYNEPLLSLKKISGQVRNAEGKVIRKLKKDDLGDLSAISGFSLYEKSRVRTAQLYHNEYPYTVEFEFELLYDGLLNWPTWYPQKLRMGVEYGRLELVVPNEMPVRYYVRGESLKRAELVQGRDKLFSWEVRHQPPFEPERYGPSWGEQVMAVHTAPERFEIEGHRGQMDSWEAFGRWYYQLNKDRDILPEDARADVQRLIQGLTDVREKAKRLYQYMQEKTRYVSVQLGIGGYQTFDAEYVHKRSYGDCKALTNYMQALLKEAGITAYPALIRAGSREAAILDKFPSNQFNHVILSVPLGADTLWLENTSQTVPFGFLGDFTENRHALLVKPEGGTLVRTPRSAAQDNLQDRKATVQILAGGDATAQVHTRFTGNQQDDTRRRLIQSSGRDRQKWLHDHIDIPSFEVLQADFSDAENKDLTFNLAFDLKLPRYASRTGKRMFLPVNLMQRWTHIPEENEKRTQPIHYIPYAFIDTDTIEYAIPTGMTIEAMPAPVEVETAFGKYRAEVVEESPGKLIYRRHLELSQIQIPAEAYPEFRNFISQVVQADKAQVVLVMP